MKLSSVYIVAAKRTPIGSFLGKLSNFSATQLGGFAIKGALESINLNPKEVDEVILGNVLGAGLGQAPARQASISAGLGVETPCTTINKVCSSGLKSLVFGSQSIALGHTHTFVTGGFESMSKAPFLLFNVHLSLKSDKKRNRIRPSTTLWCHQLRWSSGCIQQNADGKLRIKNSRRFQNYKISTRWIL